MDSSARSKVGLAALVVALAVAGGSALYLRGVKETVQDLAKEAITAPPPELHVSAPQLFPAETRLFLALHGLDQSWDDFEGWWKKFEPTAAAYALAGLLDDPNALPPEIQMGLDEFNRSLDEMEERFGYRPTTRDFFQTYGKYLALGVLPAAAPGEQPGFLAVIRMPGEKAADVFRTRLGEHTDVKLAEPPTAHGFPIFQEEREGLGALYYGVGRSFLFLGLKAAPVVEALGRLRTMLDGGQVDGTLAQDPIFQKGVPDPWEEVRLAFHVRRDAPFGAWMEELKPLDEYIANGFILAGDDPAIAVSSIETAGGWKMRSSFPFDSTRDWIDLVPAGSARVNLSVPLPPEQLREAWAPAIQRFAERPIWKELDELLRDESRLATLLREALPPGMEVDEEIPKRLKHDVAFVAALWNSMIESAPFAQALSFVFANKVYGSVESATAQTMIGIEADPLTVYHIAGGLELGRTYSEGWIQLDRFPQGLVWSVDLERLLEEGGPMAEAQVIQQVPAVIISSGRIILVLGAGLREEIVDLLSGKGTSLRSDPVFTAALEGAAPGWQRLDYLCPSELIRTALGTYQGMVEENIGEMMLTEETAGATADLLSGIFHLVDRLSTVVSQTAATLSVAYPGGSSRTVSIIDPEAEKGVPAILMPPAASKVVDLLPASTWFFSSARVRTVGIVDDLEEAFFEGMGGKEGWDELLSSIGSPGDKLLAGFYNTLLRGLDGEVGLAVSVPTGLPPLERPGLTPQEMIARAPEVVLFGEYANPEEAFDVWDSILEEAHKALNPAPFEERLRRFQDGVGPPPTGARLERSRAEGLSFAALDIIFPQEYTGEFMVYSICCVRKGSHLFLTNGVGLFTHLLGTPGKTRPTLRSGLTETFGDYPFPAETGEMSVVRTDGLVDNFHILLEPFVPMALGLTLQGYAGEQPPEDRVEAHMQGWARALEVLEDLFRTGTTSAGWSVRTGDRVEWTWKKTGPSAGSDQDAERGE